MNGLKTIRDLIMGKRRKEKQRVKATVSEVETVRPKYKVDAKSQVAKTSHLIERKLEVAPKVLYTPTAWHKIVKAIHICSDEVGWLGLVDEIQGGYLITDIFVPPQTVHGAETDIEPDAMAALMHELDYPDNLYYWGHSHVNMAVGPSGQDESQTSEYLEHCDVFIRGIYNKKGESKVDVFDVANNMVHQKVTNNIQIPQMDPTELEKFEETVKTNVKKHVYQSPNSANSRAVTTTDSTKDSGTAGGRGVRRGSVTEFPGRGGMFRNPFIKGRRQ